MTTAPPDPRNPLQLSMPRTAQEVADRTARMGLVNPVVNAVVRWAQEWHRRQIALDPPTQGQVLLVVAEQLAAQVARLQAALAQLQLRTAVPFSHLLVGQQELHQPLAQVQAVQLDVQVHQPDGSVGSVPSWIVGVWTGAADDPQGIVAASAQQAAHAAGTQVKAAQAAAGQLDPAAMGTAMAQAACSVLAAKGFSVACYVGQQLDPQQVVDQGRAAAPDRPAGPRLVQ